MLPWLQALRDAQEVERCRAVAERGLSDLQSYAPAKGADGEVSICLKGATTE